MNKLSPPPPSNIGQHGIDYVVATSQESVNSTMITYLSGVEQPYIYLAFTRGKAQTNYDPAAKYHELVSAAGADIFSVEGGTSVDDSPILQSLKKNKLRLAVKAKIGLPPDHLNYPDVLIMGKSTTQVTFNLVCSEFQVAQMEYDDDIEDYAFTTTDQADTETNTAWVFSTSVSISLENVDARTDAAIDKLDKETKDKMRAYNADVFSVQKLLLDLSRFASVSAPTIIGPESGLQGVLQDNFQANYFKTLEKSKGGNPLLGCTMVANASSRAPDPSIAVTSFNYAIMPWMDGNGKPTNDPTSFEAKIGTLNYLCVTDDRPRPQAPNWFGYNWINTKADAQDHHGVASVRRGKMAQFLKDRIVPLARKNCYQPKVRVKLKNITGMGGSNYSADMHGGQNPHDVVLYDSGRRLFKIQWAAEDYQESGNAGHNGQMRVKTYYTLELDVEGTDIIVRQEQYVHLFIKSFATSSEGNVRSRKRTDYYSMVVHDGQIQAVWDEKRRQRTVGHEKHLKKDVFQDFWTDINDTVSSITRQLTEDLTPDLGELPVSVIQGFVFPGGKTFTFTKATFSPHGDLMAFINYVEPPEGKGQ